MTELKRIGIWLDHSSAHIMELKNNKIHHKTINSKFTREEKEKTLPNSEHVMNNKEQQLQGLFYKELGEEIRNYERVILFGPTNAKAELLNTLKSDHRFSKIEIELENTDKMKDAEMHRFVKEYFTKHN